MQDVKDFGSIPESDIDTLELASTGIVTRLATAVSGVFDGRLRKRYRAPFVTPYPPALVMNVALEVTYRLFLRRGFNPQSANDASIVKDHEDAQAWLKEAADSEKGLVDLPLISSSPASGVNSGGPLGYSEASPYAWVDAQADALRDGR
jgi:hypothetical protein